MFNPMRDKRRNRRMNITPKVDIIEEEEKFEKKEVPPDEEWNDGKQTSESCEKVQQPVDDEHRSLQTPADVENSPQLQETFNNGATESLKRKRGRPKGQTFKKSVNELDRLHRDHKNSHHSKGIEHARVTRASKLKSFVEVKASKSEEDFENRAIDNKYIRTYFIGKSCVKLVRCDEPVDKKVRSSEDSVTESSYDKEIVQPTVEKEFEIQSTEKEFLEHILSSHAEIK